MRRDEPRQRPAVTIGAKLYAVVGALLVVLVVSNAVLLADLSTTTRQYDGLLTGETAQALEARKMQVEFKKQVQEWKDVLLRGANLQDRATYTGNFRSEYATVDSLAADLLSKVVDPGVRQQVASFRDAHDALQRRYELALVGFVASSGVDFHTADTLVRGQDRPPTALVDAIVTRLEQLVASRVAAQKASVQARQRVLLVVGPLAVLVLVGLLLLIVRRIGRPIRRLTTAAHTAATLTLPATIEQITTMPADGVAPSVPAFPVETRDELADLAGALTTMQSSAIGLALEQHRRERETSDMLLNLGRRNQALLARVLSYISELERVEQDPDVVAQLFRIDHATTRIRRNAASMLVLAGAPPSPARAAVVSGADVLRAALSEIEDYARVDLHHVEDASVSAGIAADLTHLLAELLENATHFSPPGTRVTVVAQRLADGYRIRVLDQGIGMTRDELAAANARIGDPAGGRGDARLLGLHVVGRLAARHRLTVSLEPSAARGITASVLIPPTALTVPSGPAHSSPPSQVIDLTTDPPRVDVQVGVSNTVALTTARRPPGVPTRVRGSQLARLGLLGDGAEVAFAPPPAASSQRLRSFQRDVDSARHAQQPEDQR